MIAPTTMHCLRDLLARHPTLLLLDSASAKVQVGLWTTPSRASIRPASDRAIEPAAGAAPADWECQYAEAGSALFACTEKLLARHALTLEQVDAFIFCEGPGSVLGIRTAAVVVRTWNTLRPRPTYSFQSLALCAHALAQREGLRNFTLIADARRETWHAQHVGTSPASPPVLPPLRRLTLRELEAFANSAGNTFAPASTPGALYTPADFRSWSQPPAHIQTTSYDLAPLLADPRMKDAPLFRDAPEPDAFLHEEPMYQTWTPQIHRAPS